MLFNKLYNTYYNVVAAILTQALEHPLSPGEMEEIARNVGYDESCMFVPPNLMQKTNHSWPLMTPEKRLDSKRKARIRYRSNLKHPPTMPLTTLEKRWLKAISMDPRIQLLGEEFPDFGDVEPLFSPEDVKIFDGNADGDDYRNEDYIRNFRLILDAIRNQYPLRVQFQNGVGDTKWADFQPDYLEYSERDDKFRVVGEGKSTRRTINLGRILHCTAYEGPWEEKSLSQDEKKPSQEAFVELQVTDEHKGLERVMLHFAHFKKDVKYLKENQYQMKLYYKLEDEKELEIRILSFGPYVKVVNPPEFVGNMRERLMKQKNLTSRISES